MKIVINILSFMLIFSGAQAQVFTALSGHVVNRTSLPTGDLRLRVTWWTADRLTIGDGCKGWKEDSVQVPVNIKGEFHLARVGSSEHTVCRRRWAIHLVTPHGDLVPNIDNSAFVSGVSQNLFETLLRSIELTKVPDLSLSFTDAKGQLIPGPELLTLRGRLFQECSDGHQWISGSCAPYGQGGITPLVKNPDLVLGHFISWSISNLKNVELEAQFGDCPDHFYLFRTIVPVALQAPVLPITWALDQPTACRRP